MKGNHGRLIWGEDNMDKVYFGDNA